MYVIRGIEKIILQTLCHPHPPDPKIRLSAFTNIYFYVLYRNKALKL